MWNIHRESRKTLTTFFSSGTKLLLPSWLLGFSTRGERDTISIMLTVPSDRATPGASRRPNWTRLVQIRRSTSLLLVQISTNCFLFLKLPNILGPSLLGMTSFTSSVAFPIRGFYYDICDCHILPVWAWTPTLNVCSYPCTKPKIRYNQRKMII